MVTLVAAAVVAPGEIGNSQANATSLSFNPAAIALENNGDMLTVEVVVADLAADSANTAQINIQHSSDFTISNPQCGALYSGGFESAATPVTGGTAFICTLQNGPLSHPSNVVATFDITKNGETTGESTISFASGGTFPTTFFEGGTAISAGTLNDLTVWDQIVALVPRNVDEGAGPLVFDVSTTAEGAIAALSATVNGSDVSVFNPFIQFVDNPDPARTGTFTITPGFDDAGTYTIAVTADNGVVAGTESFTLTVDDVNQEPVLAFIGDQSVAEDSSLNVPLSATDPDLDGLTFTATIQEGAGPVVPIPDGVFSAITDNTDGTGALDFTPGFADAGVYTVEVTVTDDSVAANGALTASEAFTLTVNDTNQPPTVDPVNPQSVDEGGTPLVVPISGTDLDGQSITFSATIDGNAIPFGFASIIDNNDGTGSLTFSPAMGAVSSDTVFSIVVSANDGIGGIGMATFDLTVTNVPEIVAPAGTVTLQGVNPGPTHDTQFLAIAPTVDLVLAANGPLGVAEASVAVDPDGSFSFTGIAEGLYLLRISADGYFTHILGDGVGEEIDVTTSDFDLGPSGENKPVRMLGGLVVDPGDGMVNGEDLSPVLTTIFTVPAGPGSGFDPRQDGLGNWVDIDGNGGVDGSDVSILISNFGLSGDQPWLP